MKTLLEIIVYYLCEGDIWWVVVLAVVRGGMVLVVVMLVIVVVVVVILLFAVLLFKGVSCSFCWFWLWWCGGIDDGVRFL